MELSLNKIKLIKSLGTIKGRRKSGRFIVEGYRALKELIEARNITPDFFVRVSEADSGLNLDISDFKASVYSVSAKEMSKLSQLVTPSDILGVFLLPTSKLPLINDLRCKLTIALDGLQDPGNLGTIIRLCDWWGIENIICSPDTVDCYNPKVIQSAMGAITRVNVVKTDDFYEFLQSAKENDLNVYGTFLKGENLYNLKGVETGIILLGNEGNGISEAGKAVVTKQVTIPSFPPGSPHVESLNVAIAAATVVSHFRSSQFISHIQ